MGLKLMIVLTFLALLASLGTGLVFLLRDRHTTASRRTWYSLTLRLSLAALLMGLVVYGLYTGQLRSQAPWDHQPSAEPASSEPAGP